MMDNFKHECKLCDNIIGDENFKVMEGVAKDVLDILLLNLTLNETQNVMCTMCSSKLVAAFNFKSKCLNSDTTIVANVDFKNPKLVDIKQVCAKQVGSKQRSREIEDRDVCRLCLHPTFGNHKSIQEVPVGSIEIYIPEINFEATTNPIICIKCHDALHVHSTFIKNCLDVAKKRIEDAMNSGEIFLNDYSLKTEEIEIKSEETDEEILSETSCDIKKEEHGEGDTSLPSQTDVTHTEGSKTESKTLYELDHQKETSAQSTFENNQSEDCNFKRASESASADHERRHKRVSEAQGNKSDHTNRNSKRHCLTRRLKGQHYECDKCTYNTKRKYHFMQHQLIHKDPSEVQIFKCDECDYKCKQKGYLKQHQLTHKNPSEVQMYKCDKCTYETKLKGNLIKHCLTHKDPSEVKMFKCDKCTFETIHKKNLINHCLRHRDPSDVGMVGCDKCTFETTQKSYLTKHCLIHKDPSVVKIFECDECDYRSIRKAHLKKHQLRHKDPSEVKMFKCDKCTYETNRKDSLITHCLSHRDPSEVKMFKCDKCIYVTKHKNNLVKHCLIHKDLSVVKIFECDECDYRSIRKAHLKQHQLRHKDPQSAMYKCDKCTYETKHKSNLIKHCLGHKDPSEVRMFMCDQCNYKSIENGNLKKHQLIHKDPLRVQMYACDKCKYITKHKRYLEHHCLRHKERHVYKY